MEYEVVILTAPFVTPSNSDIRNAFIYLMSSFTTVIIS